jgi:hypothetical protein
MACRRVQASVHSGKRAWIASKDIKAPAKDGPSLSRWKLAFFGSRALRRVAKTPAKRAVATAALALTGNATSSGPGHLRRHNVVICALGATEKTSLFTPFASGAGHARWRAEKNRAQPHALGVQGAGDSAAGYVHTYPLPRPAAPAPPPAVAWGSGSGSVRWSVPVRPQAQAAGCVTSCAIIQAKSGNIGSF